MAGEIDKRLETLGIELPAAAAPVANYVAHTLSGNILFVSGQVTIWNGEVKYTGKLGRDLDVQAGQAAARICGLNLIAQARAAAGGDLDRIARVLRLGGFVNCVADFTDHALVINGASDLMAEVFQDKGRHARAAVGCSSLPLDSAVEIDGIFELEE